MRYLGGSFQVGGYSKQYADNYDAAFGKKPAKAKNPKSKKKAPKAKP